MPRQVVLKRKLGKHDPVDICPHSQGGGIAAQQTSGKHFLLLEITGKGNTLYYLILTWAEKLGVAYNTLKRFLY